MEKSIFEKIKKQNGEHFAKTIRAFDNGIFDVPGIVNIVKYAGREAEPILNYLVSLKNVHIQETTTNEDPLKLLSKAGYNAYYVHNLKQQNAIQQYFEPDEELCTFHDATRFKRFYIINAVKKNVKDIKRQNFDGREKREDAYGTSVISIQILKNGGFISIKNRYNHTVENPDNTFNSNPDNIIKGLSCALKHKFNVDFSSHTTPLPNHYVLANGQIVKYHAEAGGDYIGSDVLVRNGKVIPIDKDKEIILDYWIFNTKTRKLREFSSERYDRDSFPRVFADEIQNKSIQIVKNPDHTHTLLADGQHVLTEKDGEIIELTIRASRMPFLNTCFREYPFMRGNTKLQTLNMPNMRVIDNGFLSKNHILQNLYAPKLRQVGDGFLTDNKMLRTINLPQLRVVGDDFITFNKLCHTFNAPNLIKIGDNFLWQNKFLRILNFPKLTETGNCFLSSNKILHQFNAPKLKQVGDGFLTENLKLTSLDLPALTEVYHTFLYSNTQLAHLNAPNLRIVGSNFLHHNLSMTELSLPNLEMFANEFMCNNKRLIRFDAPKLPLEYITEDFLPSNKAMRKFFVQKILQNAAIARVP